MKFIAMMIVPAALAVSLPSCTPAMPPVPDSGRTVVGPRGSTEQEKPWNGMSKQEAESILPFGTNRR